MTPNHPRWKEFVRLLEGADGVNYRQERGRIVWDCSHNFRSVAAILARMGLEADEIERTFQFFTRRGAYCDCEVLLNVAC